MTGPSSFYPSIQTYIASLRDDFANIPAERKARLAEIADYIRAKKQEGKKAELIFICTHNSRRSHFGQIWGQLWAQYHGLSYVSCHSGGTESTAFHPHAIEAFQEIGFDISSKGRENNPRYHLRFSGELKPLIVWSKMYTDPSNPRKRFGAVMVCDDADQNCPIVFGAQKRFSLPYKDPKEADDTPEQAQVYAERCRQIAVELGYLFSLLSQR